MPWKDCPVMEERLRFVARLLEGETITDLCREFEGPVLEAFRRLFLDHCLPAGIRSDNGLPFASPNGLYNLSRLSVFWLDQPAVNRNRLRAEKLIGSKVLEQLVCVL
jgi:hypothetical protein